MKRDVYKAMLHDFKTLPLEKFKAKYSIDQLADLTAHSTQIRKCRAGRIKAMNDKRTTLQAQIEALKRDIAVQKSIDALLGR